MEYSMEQLIPVVARLTERYTAGESTSVTYEKANQFMEAVLYCISECERREALIKENAVTAKESYLIGYDLVIEKVKRTQNRYNEMITDFCDYGNKNYRDTVTKALPGFFTYYDAMFAPQENIITMDYPTILPIENLSGIDAIERYVEWISLEQRFMGVFKEEYVREILSKFDPDYEQQFFNLCSVFLRHLLGRMLIGKEIQTNQEKYMRLEQLVVASSGQQLKEQFLGMIDRMILENCKEVPMLSQYLKADLDDFIVRLFTAAKNHNLENVIAF